MRKEDGRSKKIPDVDLIYQSESSNFYNNDVQGLELKNSQLRALYSTLARINSVITRARDQPSLFAEICKTVIEFGGFRSSWIGLVDETGWIRPVAYAGHCPEYMDNLRTTVLDFHPEGQGPTGIAVRENRIEYIMDLQNDPRTKPWREQMIRCGFKSSVAAPLHRNGTPIGVFTLYVGEMNLFGHEEIQLVQEMAEAISFAIEYLEHDHARILAEKEAYFLAYYDHLTKLPNRVFLRDWLKKAIAELDSNTLLAVALLDLDGFKEVNDSQGHAVGDQLLQEMAHRLEKTLASSAMVARIGGDEFVFVLREVSSHEIRSILEQVRRALKIPIVLEGRTWTMDCSIGLALYEDDADMDTLLRQADVAMYEAKRNGRDQYLFFTEELVKKQEKEKQIREEVKQALIRNELCLYYQPQVNMKSGRVIGVEALLRWNHPEKGLLTPDKFLPILQNYPIINDVGKWVLGESLKQIKYWNEQGLKLNMSVNISASQFQSSSFISDLITILEQYLVVPSSQLKLELLEDSVTENFDAVLQNIEQCNRLGIHVSLDDFGTGYSSLTHLQRLPVKEVKIDQTFVRELLQSPRNISIVAGLLSTALPSQLEVVAEGVEDIETGTLLRRLGCEQAQGYAIARPMPAQQVTSWLENWRNIPAWEQAEPWRLLNIDLPAAVAGFIHQRQSELIIQSTEENPLLSQNPLVVHQPCSFKQWCNSVGKDRFHELNSFRNMESTHDSIDALFEEISHLRDIGEISSARNAAHQLSDLVPIFKRQIEKFIQEISSF